MERKRKSSQREDEKPKRWLPRRTIINFMAVVISTNLRVNCFIKPIKRTIRNKRLIKIHNQISSQDPSQLALFFTDDGAMYRITKAETYIPLPYLVLTPNQKFRLSVQDAFFISKDKILLAYRSPDRKLYCGIFNHRKDSNGVRNDLVLTGIKFENRTCGYTQNDYNVHIIATTPIGLNKDRLVVILSEGFFAYQYWGQSVSLLATFFP